MIQEQMHLWQVESLRATCFHTQPVNFIDSWWEELIGEPPDNQTLEPKVGISSQEDNWAEGSLKYRTQSNRSDWLYSADFNTPDDELPSLGTIEQAATIFSSLINNWFEICPPINRIAFGAVLLRKNTDRVEGYNLINEYLQDVNLNPENSSDFLYQINRPRLLSTPGFEDINANRLSKWSVIGMTKLEIKPDGSDASQTLHQALQRSACQLGLDISTSQHYFEEISPTNLQLLFGELVQFGQEIVREGDIP